MTAVLGIAPDAELAHRFIARALDVPIATAKKLLAAEPQHSADELASQVGPAVREGVQRAREDEVAAAIDQWIEAEVAEAVGVQLGRLYAHNAAALAADLGLNIAVVQNLERVAGEPIWGRYLGFLALIQVQDGIGAHQHAVTVAHECGHHLGLKEAAAERFGNAFMRWQS